MAKRAITRDLYDRLVEGYRLTPGNHARAARYAGCYWETAKRGWELGWAKYAPWARPIKVVVVDEEAETKRQKAEAERRRKEAEEAEAERLRAEAVAAKLQEAQMVKAVRQDVLGLAIVVAEMTPAMRAAGKHVAATFLNADGTMKPNPPVSAIEALAMLNRWGHMVGRVTYASEALVKLTRLEEGKSTVNVGVTGKVELTHNEAIEELEAAGEMLARMKAEKEGAFVGLGIAVGMTEARDAAARAIARDGEVEASGEDPGVANRVH